MNAAPLAFLAAVGCAKSVIPLYEAAKAELALAKALWPRSTREPSQRLEKVESVSPDSNPPTVATADRPLSRAERRRQKRLGGGP